MFLSSGTGGRRGGDQAEKGSSQDCVVLGLGYNPDLSGEPSQSTQENLSSHLRFLGNRWQIRHIWGLISGVAATMGGQSSRQAGVPSAGLDSRWGCLSPMAESEGLEEPMVIHGDIRAGKGQGL